MHCVNCQAELSASSVEYALKDALTFHHAGLYSGAEIRAIKLYCPSYNWVEQMCQGTEGKKAYWHVARHMDDIEATPARGEGV